MDYNIRMRNNNSIVNDLVDKLFSRSTRDSDRVLLVEHNQAICNAIINSDEGFHDKQKTLEFMVKSHSASFFNLPLEFHSQKVILAASYRSPIPILKYTDPGRLDQDTLIQVVSSNVDNLEFIDDSLISRDMLDRIFHIIKFNHLFKKHGNRFSDYLNKGDYVELVYADSCNYTNIKDEHKTDELNFELCKTASLISLMDPVSLSRIAPQVYGHMNISLELADVLKGYVKATSKHQDRAMKVLHIAGMYHHGIEKVAKRASTPRQIASVVEVFGLKAVAAHRKLPDWCKRDSISHDLGV